MEYKFKLSDKIYFYDKYTNEIFYGEIIDIREAKYNWDYKIRYLIRPDTNIVYDIWIEGKYVAKDEQVLFVYLI